MKVYNPLGRTGFLPVMLAVLACVLFSNPLSAAECDASFDPASGKAVLPCINAGDGAAMFDVEMQQDGGLLFRISGITPYWYEQNQNEVGISSIEAHFIQTNQSTSIGIHTVWLFLLVDVQSLNLCGKVRGSLNVTHHPSSLEDKGRIDVRVFLQPCNLPGFGARESSLTGIFPLVADSTYEVYVGGILRKTIHVPAASTP